jgi:hypothetical protein
MPLEGPDHQRSSDNKFDVGGFTPFHWELTDCRPGSLTAVLVGTRPALTVTAPDLATLREQIKKIVMLGML